MPDEYSETPIANGYTTFCSAALSAGIISRTQTDVVRSKARCSRQRGSRPARQVGAQCSLCSHEAFGWTVALCWVCARVQAIAAVLWKFQVFCHVMTLSIGEQLPNKWSLFYLTTVGCNFLSTRFIA